MRYSGMNGRMGMEKACKRARRWVVVSGNMARHWKRLAARGMRRVPVPTVEEWDESVMPVRARVTSWDVA